MSEKLQEATIKKLLEVVNNKVLLYPSNEYYDRMDPEDITNEKGILFGWFNDEEIMAYSTGFNSIQDMEKAVKNKKYMIDSFVDDEDFDNMSGEEWWNYIVETIENSYVDGDSYWSMFLLDTNQNYKILYCGDEEPEVEVIKPTKNTNTLTFIIANNDRYFIDGTPLLQLGKYKMGPNITKDGHIDTSDIEDWAFIAGQTEYDIQDLPKNITAETIKSMITPEIEQKYVKATQEIEQKRQEVKDKLTELKDYLDKNTNLKWILNSSGDEIYNDYKSSNDEISIEITNNSFVANYLSLDRWIDKEFKTINSLLKFIKQLEQKISIRQKQYKEVFNLLKNNIKKDVTYHWWAIESDYEYRCVINNYDTLIVDQDIDNNTYSIKYKMEKATNVNKEDLIKTINNMVYNS